MYLLIIQLALYIRIINSSFLCTESMATIMNRGVYHANKSITSTLWLYRVLEFNKQGQDKRIVVNAISFI